MVENCLKKANNNGLDPEYASIAELEEAMMVGHIKIVG
jgi:hypothetical protein